ncbi:cytochrome P450 [Streptomyces sp. SM12]|uniref:cytochrome P450 n=1 Tax=Streptomyces sp. SM12 TaxID=1071602 RepID=UPI000CD5364A|nr:cytochrome P450 [Streptomyces sp. SM12]
MDRHTDHHSASPPPGCPAHQVGMAPVPLWGPDFAADPQGFYRVLRQYGPAAPVEVAPGVPANLVTDYAAALRVLQSPKEFGKDSRRWRDFNEGRVPMDSAAVPMMAYRPNSLFSDGAEHLRLRQAITDSLGRIDSHLLTRHVERVSTYLVGQFGDRGSADLLNEYSKLMSLLVFNELFGCPPEIGDQLISGMSGIFDGVDPEKSNREILESVMALVSYKRTHPGQDVTSWMMAHPAQLSDEEMMHQLVLLGGAGSEPTRNLIANGLLLILSDERYFGGVHGAGLLVEDALDEVMWNSPPLANYGVHYPLHDVDLGGSHLRAGDPVVISFAAANTDPALSSARQQVSKRAHLGWSAGPHACPAKDPAQLIAVTAIEKLLNQLPDVELSVAPESLTWRPGIYHRALATLPAHFTPVVTERPFAAAQASADASEHSGRHAAGRRGPKGGWWSGFLNWWRE